MKAVRLERKVPGGGAGGGSGGGSNDDHDFEPAHGLPELLPAGEKMHWQGSPEWLPLAHRVFHIRKLVAYFAALVVLRMVVMLAQGEASATSMAVSALWISGLGAFAIGSLTLVAWLMARTAVYTITDKRVVMRVGIVLTLTFNIPFKRITGAGLHVAADGTGDLPLMLSGEDRIAWLHLWPHCRPFKLAHPEPMLRSVPQAAVVAQLLSQAWSQSTGLALAPAGALALPPAGGAQPAFAGR